MAGNRHGRLVWSGSSASTPTGARLLERWLAVAAACLALAPPVLAGEVFQAQCVRVIDGSTVAITRDGNDVEVRLEGIDAPELEQSFGIEAKQGASSLMLSKQLIVEVQGTDQFGRTIGRVHVGQADASLEMVKAGLAWYSEQPSPNDALAGAEAEARAARRGLWSAPVPVPPWAWRAQHPHDSHKDLSSLAAKVHIKRDPDGSVLITGLPVQPAQPTPAEPKATPPHP